MPIQAPAAITNQGPSPQVSQSSQNRAALSQQREVIRFQEAQENQRATAQMQTQADMQAQQLRAQGQMEQARLADNELSRQMTQQMAESRMAFDKAIHDSDMAYNQAVREDNWDIAKMTAEIQVKLAAMGMIQDSNRQAQLGKVLSATARMTAKESTRSLRAMIAANTNMQNRENSINRVEQTKQRAANALMAASAPEITPGGLFTVTEKTVDRYGSMGRTPYKTKVAELNVEGVQKKQENAALKAISTAWGLQDIKIGFNEFISNYDTVRQKMEDRVLNQVDLENALATMSAASNKKFLDQYGMSATTFDTILGVDEKLLEGKLPKELRNPVAELWKSAGGLASLNNSWQSKITENFSKSNIKITHDLNQVLSVVQRLANDKDMNIAKQAQSALANFYGNGVDSMSAEALLGDQDDEDFYRSIYPEGMDAYQLNNKNEILQQLDEILMPLRNRNRRE